MQFTPASSLFRRRETNGAPLETVSTARAVVNEDGAILIDSEQGMMYSLNRSGGLIWAGLNERLSKEAICQRLCEQFGIPLDEAEKDFDEFIASLEKNKLLRRSAAGR